MIHDDRTNIKNAFLEYLLEVPSYKFASKAIKKSVDTTKNWRDEDSDFADRCEAAIAEWVKKTLKRTKPEYQLERLLREDFSPRQEFVGVDSLTWLRKEREQFSD
jgi:hypothetical protein